MYVDQSSLVNYRGEEIPINHPAIKFNYIYVLDRIADMFLFKLDSIPTFSYEKRTETSTSITIQMIRSYKTYLITIHKHDIAATIRDLVTRLHPYFKMLLHSTRHTLAEQCYQGSHNISTEKAICKHPLIRVIDALTKSTNTYIVLCFER